MIAALGDTEKKVPLAEVLLAGGIPLRGNSLPGEEAVRRVQASLYYLPSFSPRVVAYFGVKGIAIILGCSSPSDIDQALEMGLDVVKFFPPSSRAVWITSRRPPPYHHITRK